MKYRLSRSNMVQQILLKKTLPASFFKVGAKPYSQLPFKPEEDPAFISRLFELEADHNDIILFTDHEEIRLVGIFPDNTTDAYFGFWETTNNWQKNKEAFALLEKAAHERNRTNLTGPINFNTFHNYRLRLTKSPYWDMFDREPVNPDHYPQFLLQLGFSSKLTFESRLIRKEIVPSVYLDKKQFLKELQKIPFSFIPLNPVVWQELEEEIFVLIHEIFSANPAYKPVSKEQFKLLYNTAFAAKLCPYSSVLFRDKRSGRLAAMSFCFPNYHELPVKANQVPNYERDFPLLHKKVLLAKSVGVHPDFRKQGLMSFLGAYSMLSFQERYEEVIFCLMRSDNFSLHFTNGLPYESATYALFHKPLTR